MFPPSIGTNKRSISQLDYKYNILGRPLNRKNKMTGVKSYTTMNNMRNRGTHNRKLSSSNFVICPIACLWLEYV